jgi:hypothetical protein
LFLYQGEPLPVKNAFFLKNDYLLAVLTRAALFFDVVAED